jgi:hypothetical protein
MDSVKVTIEALSGGVSLVGPRSCLGKAWFVQKKHLKKRLSRGKSRTDLGHKGKTQSR